MVEVNEVRQKLADYLSLAKKLPLADFEDWFVRNSWDVHKANNPELRELVHSIELRLSEFSSGHLSEQALRKELTPFVTSIRTSVIFGQNANLNAPVASDIRWLEVGEILFAAPARKESSAVFV